MCFFYLNCKTANEKCWLFLLVISNGEPGGTNKKSPFLLKDLSLTLTVCCASVRLITSIGSLLLTEIANKIGFSSAAYFSTVFKSKFIVTPSEFRDKGKASK